MVHKSDYDKRRCSLREPNTYISVDNEKMPHHRREHNNLKKQTSDTRPTKRMLWKAIVDYRKNPLIKTMQATTKQNTGDDYEYSKKRTRQMLPLGRIESNRTQLNRTEPN